MQERDNNAHEEQASWNTLYKRFPEADMDLLTCFDVVVNPTRWYLARRNGELNKEPYWLYFEFNQLA
jgi:hypothetical protein